MQFKILCHQSRFVFNSKNVQEMLLFCWDSHDFKLKLLYSNQHLRIINDIPNLKWAYCWYWFCKIVVGAHFSAITITVVMCISGNNVRTCHQVRLHLFMFIIAIFNFRTVPLSSFACAPVVSPANMFLSVSEGRHVSLTCNVEADPLPIVTWTLDQVPLDHVQTQDHQVSVEQQIISFGIIR